MSVQTMQKFVFNKQMEIVLNLKIFIKISNEFNLEVNRQALESYLNKYQNIIRVVLWRGGEGQELDLITKYCRRVTKLVLPSTFHRQELIEFGDKHGQSLELLHTILRNSAPIIKAELFQVGRVRL